MTETAQQCPLDVPAQAAASAGERRQRFIRQVLRLAGPYWRCQHCGKVRGMTLLLLLLTMAQVALAVWGNYWQRALYDALEQRSVRGVVMQVGVFGLIMASSIAVTAAHLMVKRWLQIDWRAWLTERLAETWLDKGRHYRLLFAPGEHDNPDQRIAEDIHIATETAIALAHSLTYSLLTLGLFINILWTISGSIIVPGTEMHIPGYMVPLAFAYAIFGSFFGWMVGRPLVRTTNALQTAEATYRFGLSQARENTEAIAILRAEPLERVRSRTRFRDIIRSWNRQSWAYMGLIAFGTGYGSILPVLPILVAAPQYIHGVMTLGALMQAAQAFAQLTSSLSWPVDNMGELARCRASADRVLSLYEDMQDLEAKDARHPQIALEETGGENLTLEDLCIAEPSGRVLVEHLDAEVKRGERVIVNGDPAVTGALFKVLGGIWPWGTGRVRLPADDGMFFLAQRTFLPEGTLREAICYPSPPETFSAREIAQALETVGLTRLVARIEERDDWEQVLPQRAQQQLGFARALLRKPPWILLEEATDAFDSEGERQIIETLIRELPQTTMLNICFHTGLDDLHGRVLTLSRTPGTKILFGDRRAGNGNGNGNGAH